MYGTFRYDISALLSHQIEELVDYEGRRHVRDAAPRDVDGLAADGTSESRRVAILSFNNSLEAVQAHRV